MKSLSMTGAAGAHRRRATSRGASALGAAVVLATVMAATAGSAPASRATARATPAPRAGTPLVVETFKNATAPEFTGYNEACLTGAPEGTPMPGAHPLGGCEHSELGPVPPHSAAPIGYLRLTDSGNNRSAAVLYNHPVPADEGLDVQFEQWQYGSLTPAVPADGISFFLTDGEGSLTAPGQFGGSLGYAQKQQHHPSLQPLAPGAEDGFLGVGLDTLGNYFADTEERGHDCPASQSSPALNRPGDADEYLRGPNIITLRGPGNNLDGYCYMGATTDFAHSQPPAKPWPSSLPGALQGPLREFSVPNPTPEQAQQELASSGRIVNVRITPTPDSRTIVDVNFEDGHGFHRVLNEPTPVPIPKTYKFGFAASTGHFSDVHLIRNIVIETDKPLPELNLVKQIALPRPGNLRAGDKVTYEYVLTNGGTIAIEHIVVHDAKIGPVTCPAQALEPDKTFVCTATYTVTAQDVEAGAIDNTAFATGDANGAPVTSNKDSEHVPIELPAGIDVVKFPATPGPYHVGQTVRFTYTVRNTGGVPLDNIMIRDDHVTGITCSPTMIAPENEPGDTATCHGTYVITAADGVNGQVVNTAVAVGTHDDVEVVSEPDQAMLMIGGARLHLAKRVASRGPFFRGSLVRYAYVVTNTGQLALHDIALQDTHVSGIICDKTTLEPGESTACHGTFRVRDIDFRARHVLNTAQAFGIESNGDIFASNFASALIRVQARHEKKRKSVPVTG